MENKKAKEKVAVNGIVIEAFPNTLFKVKLDSDGSGNFPIFPGKMSMNRIRVLIATRLP